MIIDAMQRAGVSYADGLLDALGDLVNNVKEAVVSDEYDENDPVEHPAHYTNGSIETIDYINEVLGDEGLIYFCWGNALKYLSRANFKNNRREDLLKANWYTSKIKEKLNDNEEVLK